MKISNIAINHYKSIKSPINLNNLSHFHILVGPNNAGKTNIIDAINLLLDEDLNRERFYDKNADIEITIQKGNNKHVLKCVNGKINSKTAKEIKNSFIRISDDIDYNLLKSNFKIFRKKYLPEYEMFSRTLRKYFKDVEINENLFFQSIHADNKIRSMKRMGEGFKRLFVILFYIFHPQYKIILIDEPETHLHPSIIKKFIHILEKKYSEHQVFLTTHHRSFIHAKYLPHIWRIIRDKKRHTSVHGFGKNNIDTNRLIQEINDDNSEMLFADKVLLVEGISDKIFMQEMINRFYKKDKDIKLIYTSGKGCIDIYSKLCDIFNIPYAIMLDHDALYSPSLQRVKKCLFSLKKYRQKRKKKS